jgi:protein O-GlcNAc transferase
LSEAARLLQAGQPDRAAEACAAMLRQEPDNFDATNLLGLVRGVQGRLAEAAECLRRAVALDPRSVQAHRNLGIALGGLNQHAAAAASFEAALAIAPDDAGAHSDLGVTLATLGRHEAATAHLKRAVVLEPRHADAHNNLGGALMALGRSEQAIASFEAALRLRPGDADVHHNLGQALAKLKAYEPAIASFQRAIELRRDHAGANNGLGVVLAAIGRHEAAAASFERALALRPEDVEARLNLANVLKTLKRYDAALAACRAALARRPDDTTALTLAAALQRHVCDWQGLDAIDARLIDQVRARRGAVLPFVFLTLTDDPQAQLACARQYWQHRQGAIAPVAQNVSKEGGRRLRLGYISADFHDHATARLAAQLFEQHDRSRFDVFAFSHGPDDRSAMRQRLEKAFDHFVDVRRESDDAIARRIAEQEIDILVDLKGHTEDGRLEILARRPAPVQVHYLGYPGTLGTDFIDYLIVDRFVVPPEQESNFAEKLVFLADCYQINDAERAIAETAPRRTDCGLPDDGFVFCCFNNTYKIMPAVFDVWMRLLQAVPGSVLWLLADNRWAEDNLRRAASSRGVEPHRLVFAPRLRLSDHLARHRLADLFLDTAPVNAHTTASDALWAGLPIVTCAGRTFVARVAGSLLHAAGLPELVTDDLEAYSTLALTLAQAPARLEALRTRLQVARSSAPLFDTARTRRQLEAAYLRMSDIWRRGEPPRSFALPPHPPLNGTG